MSLVEYRAKRRLGQTPEPVSGTTGRGPLRFVIQKHLASRLHYDLRLELQGTLKSWAVPKGPTLDHGEKRLAVMVEDHPLDYRTFEGVIPKGNYGAGPVMVWDEGVYHSRQHQDRATSEEVLADGLRDGHLKIMLYGKKLQGEFALIKLKRGEPNAWLLVKKDDQFASKRDVLLEDRSARTGRTMEEIRQGITPTNLDLRGAPRTRMPHHLKPMLAKTVAKPFDREGWFFEIKWDGYRAIAEVEPGQVQLYSRRMVSFNYQFAPVVESLHALERQLILDGEILVVDARGRADFASLQNYEPGSSSRLTYYVFDLLYLDGHDLRKFPLKRRKQLLTQVLPNLPNVRISEHLETQGVAFFNAVSQQGVEGMMAKDGRSSYQPGVRSDAWLKVKTGQRLEAVIAGFSAPQGSRESLGSLVLGVYDEDELRFVGQCGTGFTDETLRSVRAALGPLRQKTCPFPTRPETRGVITWVKPELRCEVSFQEWSKDGHLRFPVYQGLSPTKPARAAPPQPVPAKPATVAVPAKPTAAPGTFPAKEGVIDVGGHPVPLTNLDKPYWPEDGYVKGDLVRYYHEIASAILPHLVDRPESMHRHPNGIHGKSFFQKNVIGSVPPWLQTIELPTDSADRDTIRYLLCQNEATLVYLANLGCIELNPWMSRQGRLEAPDFVVVDLDPENLPFPEVVRAALAVRKVLEDAGAACYCKTSGKRGLHVYVPLGAKYSYDLARNFAQLVGQLVHSQMPDATSLLRSPKLRQRRVYLDYLQNGHGKTLAAPYSVRPVAGAQVSTPLKWTEVRATLDPGRHTIRTVPARLQKLGDLWQPLLGPGIELADCLERLARKFGTGRP